MTPPSAIEMERSEHLPRSGAAHVFLVELFRSGKPVFEWSGNTSPEAFALGLQDEIWSAAAIRDLLEDEHDAAAADWPGPAHGFHEPAARWGAAMLVLGLVPAALAQRVQVQNPELVGIGIGAGADVAGQVLVLHDMLGVTQGKLPRFVRNFMAEGGSIGDGLRRYVQAVKQRSFPDTTLHTY